VAESSPADVTRLLVQWQGGDAGALERLIPLVYAELRRIAHRHMRDERPNHPLQTTALVHEAYLRLIDVDRVNWQSRNQFYAVSARMMRRVLVEEARKRDADKRGADASRSTRRCFPRPSGEPTCWRWTKPSSAWSSSTHGRRASSS
jgi:RNA polymerase sigma factor (TIGR02999 family)